MCQRSLPALVLALLLSYLALAGAPASATSCPPHDPALVITPECTFLVLQYDPGVWVDQLGSYWTTAPGDIFPKNVGKDPRVLRIGVR